MKTGRGRLHRRRTGRGGERGPRESPRPLFQKRPPGGLFRSSIGLFPPCRGTPIFANIA